MTALEMGKLKRGFDGIKNIMTKNAVSKRFK